jgi:signal peptidase I
LKRSGKPELVAHASADLRLSGPALTDLLRLSAAKGAALRFRARGQSMGPFVRSGDLVTVAPLTQGSPRVGEIVAFARGADQVLRVHRLIAVLPGGYLFKGDNAPGPDLPVQRSDILGKVSRIERNGRRVRLGTGPERLLLAWLSSLGVLLALMAPARRLLAWWRQRRARAR